MKGVKCLEISTFPGKALMNGYSKTSHDIVNVQITCKRVTTYLPFVVLFGRNAIIYYTKHSIIEIYNIYPNND